MQVLIDAVYAAPNPAKQQAALARLKKESPYHYREVQDDLRN